VHSPTKGEPNSSENEVKTHLLSRVSPMGGGAARVSNDWRMILLSFLRNFQYLIMNITILVHELMQFL